MPDSSDQKGAGAQPSASPPYGEPAKPNPSSQKPPGSSRGRLRAWWVVVGCLGFLLVVFLAAVAFLVVLYNRLASPEPLAPNEIQATDQERQAARARLTEALQNLKQSDETTLELTERELNVLASGLVASRSGIHALDTSIQGEKVTVRFSSDHPVVEGRYLNLVYKGKVAFQDGQWKLDPTEVTIGGEDYAPEQGEAGVGKQLVRGQLRQTMNQLSRQYGVALVQLSVQDGSLRIHVRKKPTDTTQPPHMDTAPTQ